MVKLSIKKVQFRSETLSETRKKKILIVAHNHPLFFPGGAEIVAYDLFKAIDKEENEYQAFFLAAVAGVSRKICHEGTPFQMLVDSPNEVLFWGDSYDYFYHSQKVLNFIYSDFKFFLQQLQPDIIHFHHIVRIGLEVLQIARQVLPNVKIVYTIHEYLLMCYRDGQMVRTENNELCEYAAPDRCHQCFPEFSPQQFKMREAFIKAHLELVDMFISPSHFLANRFIQWGIPSDKMRVIENGRPITESAPHRVLVEGEKRNVFGYFGQINPYKGILVILEAVKFLVKNNYQDFRVEICGNMAQGFPDFQEKFWEFLDEFKDYVNYNGQYKLEELKELIQPVDWVIVPSTWWENSPLVIQEVFMHKRPIICSNIGGMAEKVEDQVTGLHFRVGNAVSLAKTMEKASYDGELWKRLVSQIQPRLSIEDCSMCYTRLYDQL